TFVPCNLTVKMRVNVNEPRRDDQPRCVDFLCGFDMVTGDRRDKTVDNRDIGLERHPARTVYNRSAPNNEIRLDAHPAPFGQTAVGVSFGIRIRPLPSHRTCAARPALRPFRMGLFAQPPPDSISDRSNWHPRLPATPLSVRSCTSAVHRGDHSPAPG